MESGHTGVNQSQGWETWGWGAVLLCSQVPKQKSESKNSKFRPAFQVMVKVLLSMQGDSTYFNNSF